MKKPLRIISILLALALCLTTTCAAVNPLSYPKFRAWDPTTGTPLAGGKLYTYYPGGESPKYTYSDSGLTTPNPLIITLNSNGEADVYLSGSTKLVLKTSTGASVWTMDSVTTPNDYFIDAAAYGSNQAGIEAAITAIGANNRTLNISPGTWSITGDMIIPSNIALRMDKGAVLAIAAGKTVTINGALDAGPYQIFSGTGTAVLGSLVYVQYGEWTGSSGINIITAASIQNQQYVAATAGGTVDIITASVTPIPAALVNNLKVCIEASGANTSATPTFNLNALGAKTVVKGSNQALVAGDIPGVNARIELIYDLSLTKWVLMNPAYGVSTTTSNKDNYAILRNKQNNGTGGGGSTAGSFLTIPLTEEASDPDAIVSLAANQFTLAAGTYEVQAVMPFYQVERVTTRLYNATDAAIVTKGEGQAQYAAAGTIITVNSHLRVRFTIAAPKVFEIQYYCNNTFASNALGYPASAGQDEIYAIVHITKIN